jgi:hypothetical protein
MLQSNFVPVTFLLNVSQLLNILAENDPESIVDYFESVAESGNIPKNCYSVAEWLKKHINSGFTRRNANNKPSASG